jgi:3-phosphoshikimate 1-carboxyvinyltransferase
MAAACNGGRLVGTKRLAIKESDRGMAMAKELSKFGIPVAVMEDEIHVYPHELKSPKEHLDSHNDHRIAMTMAVLCTITGGVIKDAEAVSKSFPNFFDVLENLGIKVTREA